MNDEQYLALHRAPRRWITVQAYKHDGSFHRQWSPAYLAFENEDFWALCSRNSQVTEGDGRKWITREHAVFFLFKKKWFNILAMRKEKGVVFYVNIASPTILDQGFLRYIDYDLDVKLYPDGVIRELDEKEYRAHIARFQYPLWIQEKCLQAEKEIEHMMKEGEPPFNEELCRKIFSEFVRITSL